MKSFKVLSLMSVFLLLFAGVALAQNAASVIVEVGYPCEEGQEECNTGEAVSRDVGGDVVNILITLVDASGNPATAGPNGELLSTLSATVSTTLGNTIEANEFAADATGAAFGEDATARANVDYSDAVPGVDQVVATIPSEPDALVGQASVNVVAPPALGLVVRTLRGATPPLNLYDPIPDQANNLGGWEPAGADVEVTVLAQIGGEFTPDPSLEGKTVIVKAYADYSEDGVAGGGVPGADIAGGFEEDPPIAEETFTISGGQVTDTIRITNAGPGDIFDGLNIVFTAEIDEEGGISTTLMNGAGLELPEGDDFTLDTVQMRPLSPDQLLVAMDPYGNGNLVMEEDCLVVFDDADGIGPGTVVDFVVVVVDILGNATRAVDDINVEVDLRGGELEDQLTASCGVLDNGDYLQGCTIGDTDPTVAGQVIRQEIEIFDSPGGLVGSDEVTVDLVPGDSPDIDLAVTVDPLEGVGLDLDAGDQVVLTLETSDYFPFSPGETLEISAMGPGGPQWISLSDYAAADTTLELPANDDDAEAEGLQLPPIAIFGPCTIAAGENVVFTVTLPGRCDESVDSNPILDIDPGDPANLAVVSLAGSSLETDTELDDPTYLGNDPVNITDSLIADGETFNDVLECGDLEVRDEFDNVLTDNPDLACNVGLGFLEIDVCEVDIRWVVEAADTTQTLACEASNPLYSEVEGRSFTIPLVEEIGEGPSGDATALIARQEAPQDQDGNQIMPCGESIVQIFANGDLESSIPIQISFGEGTVEGAEKRNLNSDSALAEPLPATLSDGEVIRLVIYAPTAGPVNLVVTDVSAAEEPLTSGEWNETFCQERECGEVTVTCEPTSIGCEECTVCTATTSGEGCNEPSYTWDSSGGTVATGNTGNSITICEDTPEAQSTITVTATDTANENKTGSTTVEDTCGDDPIGPCLIDVIPESLPKSHWTALYPVVFRIETTGIEDLTAFTPVTIACDADGDTLLSKSVLKTGKAVLPNFGTNTTIIVQTALIWPAWWTQSLGLESETCTVTVEGCLDTDTFELNYLSVLGIPLSQ